MKMILRTGLVKRSNCWQCALLVALLWSEHVFMSAGNGMAISRSLCKDNCCSVISWNWSTGRFSSY